MRRLLVAAVLIAFAASPAHASFAVFCEGPDGTSVDIPLGGGVGLTPLRVTIEMAGRTWTSETSLEDPQAIVTAQAFGEGGVMNFDFTDPNFETVVARVRLFSSSDGEAIGGIVEVAEAGSAAISCSYG